MSARSSSILRAVRLAASRVAPSSRRSFAHTACVGEPKKPSIKAIAELRKLAPGTSMIKAKEALLASRTASAPDDDSIELALQWLDTDRTRTGAKKADKVAAREAREGLVAVTVLSDGLPSSVELKGELKPEAVGAGIGATGAATGGIVEVNCETDFVAKNDVFTQLVRDIVHTVALFPALAGTEGAEGEAVGFVHIPVEELLAFPLLPSSPEVQGSSVAPRTVGAAIVDVVARLGEKISIARAAAIPPPRVPAADAPRRSTTATSRGASVVHLASAFAHGGAAGFAAAKDAAKPGYVLTAGRVASLLTTRLASSTLPDSLAEADGLQSNVRALTRSLARQVAGMQTTSIHPNKDDDAQSSEGNPEVSTALYQQPFMMLLPAAAPAPDSSAQPVHDVLRSWAAHHKLDNKDADVVHVLNMHRWQLGETAAPPQSSADGFADEVRKAAGLA